VIAKRQSKRSDAGDAQRLEPLMTVGQLAECWQVSRRAINRMIADKRIPVIRIGRSVRIHPTVAKLDPDDKI
jgi:excisionase family DNA binding protein